jgi:hypothetical protein
LGTKNSNALDIDSRRGGSARASIDGFVSVKRAANPPHSPLHHVAAHKPAPSKTLMRSAVKKPRIQSPAQIKAQSRTDILTRVPKQSITPKNRSSMTGTLKSVLPATSQYFCLF